jgi:hypothetical protein
MQTRSKCGRFSQTYFSVRPRKQSLCVAAAAITFVCLALLILLPASTLALTKDCEPKGWLANARSAVQGARFWTDQLVAIDVRVTLDVKSPSLADIDARVAAATKQANDALEVAYKDRPELRPSKASVRADALRHEADQIERDELDAQLASMRTAEIQELNICRQAISRKVADK